MVCISVDYLAITSYKWYHIFPGIPISEIHLNHVPAFLIFQLECSYMKIKMNDIILESIRDGKYVQILHAMEE
jgi:hypothetical protein